MPQMSSIVASDQVSSAGVNGKWRSHRMPPLIVSAGVARHWSDRNAAKLDCRDFRARSPLYTYLPVAESSRAVPGIDRTRPVRIA